MKRKYPAPAIMAALSVQSQIGGICSGQLARTWIEWHKARFADTPPATRIFLAEYSLAAWMVFVTSTSTTAVVVGCFSDYLEEVSMDSGWIPGLAEVVKAGDALLIMANRRDDLHKRQQPDNLFQLIFEKTAGYGEWVMYSSWRGERVTNKYLSACQLFQIFVLLLAAT